MLENLPFSDHVKEYDAWFDNNPFVFQTELAAIRELWPAGTNLMSLELGSASGRFAQALGITEGVDPFSNMNEAAEARNVKTICGIAESLPYAADQFDVVLANCSIHYFSKPQQVFREAYRVLKPRAWIIVAFIDKDSMLGKIYEKKKQTGTLFHKHARSYSVEEVKSLLATAGFRKLESHQTIFGQLNNIQSVQPLLPSTGMGSYILLKAQK